MKNITKLHQFKHILLGLSLILSFSASAQFTCDASALYQTIQIRQDISGVGNTGDYIFYRVDPATANFIFIANLSRDDDGAGTNDIALFDNINAIAFNPVDNYIYGIDHNDDYLYRIDSNGNVKYLGQIEGAITATSSSNLAGTIDANGMYYIFGYHGKLIKVDLSSTPVGTIQSSLAYSTFRNSADIAINPVDGLIYGWHTANKYLFTINPNTGQTNTIGPPNSTSWMKAMGALYFTSSGQLIGYGDDGRNPLFQETLVQINTDTGVPTIIGTGESVQVNDGASCPFGIELLKDGPDTTRLNETFTYTFTVFNASGNVLNDLEFTDNLPSNLTFNSNPYDLTNGLSSTGTTNGLSSAVLTLNNVPVGESSFKIDVVASCSFTDNEISNQATIVSSFATVISDDPDIPGIDNPTITNINRALPTFSVPDTIDFEGCTIQDINSSNAVFPYSSSESSDVKNVFNTETGYIASNTDNILSITYIDNITSTECPIEVSREFTLTDLCNNTEKKTQTITVSDNTAPTFTVPSDIEIFTDASCNYDATVTVTGDVTDEADNCSTAINATYSDSVADGDCEGNYVITRTWSLIDDCGNAAANQTQTITVSDNTAPTFTAPGDIEIFTDASCNYDATVTVTGDVTDEVKLLYGY